MTKYGQGSLFQRASDGRWIGRLPDGRGGYRHATGMDRDDVQRRLRDMRKEQARTTSASRPRGGERLRDYLPRWLAEVASLRLRPRTYAGHTQVVNNHLIPHLGRYRVAELHQSDVRRMVATLSRTLAAQTIHNIVRVLSSALQHALRDDLVEKNVARLVTLPRRRRDQPLPSMSQADLRRFLDVTRGHPHWPIWLLTYATGMRRGEVLSLRWSDVTEDTVSVNGTYRYAGVINGKRVWRFEEPKTPTSRRTLWLTPAAKAAIRAQKAQATSAVVVFARANGEPMQPDHVTKTFQRVLLEHGFPSVRLHSLRHSAAIAMLDELGGDIFAVSKTLGHGNLSTTSDVYGSAADDARKRAAAAMGRVMEGMG